MGGAVDPREIYLRARGASDPGDKALLESGAADALRTWVRSRPDDPAVLNNLAQRRLRQGDPVGAHPYAERALEILPDSPEIRRTMERVKAALEKKNAAAR